MRAAIFIVVATFLTLGLLTYLYVEHLQDKDSIRLKESELKMLRRENLEIRKNYELRGDSLLIAFETIRQANAATAKAHEETKAYRKKFESVKFVKFESDSARNNALKKLYKSYQP